MSNEPVAYLWQHSETGRTRVVMTDQIVSTDDRWFLVGPLHLDPAPDDTALPRLLRIMGTFDLTTGHASTMDEALDELESELRDVLGHYRAAKPDDTALLRQALEVLESVYPYTDSLICYASTVDEHPPNAIDGNVRDALTALRERLGEKT